MVPVRTCIGCRRRAEQNSVVRFALDNSQHPPRVLVDADRREPGRGAWLHVQSECFETALKRRAFHRAFRQQVDTAHLTFDDVVNMSGSHESGLEEMNTR
ncbi:MAG: YlxR family protein [Nesterenkonia sp.]